MIVESQAVGPFFKNGFVAACEETKEAVIIDPCDEVASLLAFVERSRLTVRYILLPHAHVDYVTGVAVPKRRTAAEIHLPPNYLFLYELSVEMGEIFGLSVEPQP